MEISTGELIDVAKHVWHEGMSHADAVRHAHHLIREAHLFNANIRAMNQRSPGQPVAVADLVWRAERNSHGQPLKGKLLVALMKSLGRGADYSNASKKFNEWIAESVRKESFLAVIPHDPTAPGSDPALHRQLLENGWLRSHIDDRDQHHILIPRSTGPQTTAPRRPRKGEHETRPHWETKDVWWPAADERAVKERKAQYLNPAGDAFLKTNIAEQALGRFKDWLELEAVIHKAPPAKRQPRDGGGHLLSPKDKGAARAEKGRYAAGKKQSHR